MRADASRPLRGSRLSQRSLVPLLAALAALGALGACAPDARSDRAAVAHGSWQGLDVAVEVRPFDVPPAPSLVSAGHNEVVVSVTGEMHRPIFDAQVQLRALDDGPWVQAIEDGHVGIYRRAVDFGPRPADRTLQLRLQREQEQTTLSFPVQSLTLR